MARNIDDIQREIERSRRQLAATLDEIANRTKPAHLVEDAKQSLSARLNDPQVQKVLGVAGAVVCGIVVVSFVAKRRRKAEIRELKELLATR
ncbi:DUF3618 domain-containing protein [Corynebacterium sp. ES2794-CONJ1]|uniref:DUF3618 domain-containing protein n=1 Tax=unclassified Corynebacterium TaxID=2624378 RepID=UPI0021676F9C|nr:MULTISPECIES: DUF3618 domain-containing protein [unclassified Corynebacterium]MCS4490670.1 DUF3618 domain-containing protein [Corynebacterium sp. ES2775-CONJ]MCS4492472.1 DUF3618 domain-containing protein [Corynebacterium sp. ES2715-CONJ3]MCS4532564.1 DUF3618 domain-containing protein [Corynebacterium sp. ES2730-CONJ]MCU9519959.1 DUF3618 domain-containing protein [Corynebacterium sp. ES2794-CONJ1]